MALYSWWLEMASLRQMEYYVAVADARSLRKAARRLGVTQPTLTVQLKALEDTLGVQLFERTRNATLLTPAGRELLPDAMNLLSQWRNVIESAHLLSDDAHSTYRLGVPQTLGPYLLPQLLPSIHQRYANLRLHVREEVPDGLLQGLEEGRFDLVIGPITAESESIVRVPLFREPLLLASPVDMDVAPRGDLAESDLSGLEVLAVDERHALRREVERICKQRAPSLIGITREPAWIPCVKWLLWGWGWRFSLPFMFEVKSTGPKNCVFKSSRDGRCSVSMPCCIGDTPRLGAFTGS